MKRSTKRHLILAAVLALIGAAFCIAGVCFGFTTENMQEVYQIGREKMGYVEDIVRSSLHGSGHDTGNEDHITFPASAEQMTFSGVKKLTMDTGVADCIFVPEDTDEWQISLSGKNSSLTCGQDGEELKIRTKKEKHWLVPWSHEKEEIQVEIRFPKDIVLDDVDIDQGVGNITMKSGGWLITEKMKLDTGVGNTQLYLDVREKLSVDSGIGEVDLTLRGRQTDYDYDLDCGLGELKVGGDSYGGIGAEQKIDNRADCKVKVDSGIGTVTIHFEE